MKLGDGGSRLEVDGKPPLIGPPDEYPDIYREFAKLLAGAAPEINAAPFQLVADAFMVGSRTEVEKFVF
ncbi:MAG: hypothetical protein NVS3B5_00200 [Sphingomicrobium sp.]